MNEQNSPADLRLIIRAVRTGFGDPNSLANVNTSEYPDGASCYVIADRALWNLDKSSTQAALSGYCIVPGSGPGRWFRQQTSETKAGPVQLIGTGANAYAVDTNWGISSSANFSKISLNEPDLWTLTALGGILTYTGVAQTFLLDMTAVLQIGNADAARNIFAVLSYNNDFTGAAALSTVASSQIITSLAGGWQVKASRIVQLVATDTVRIKLAGPAAAVSLSMLNVSLTATPV